MLGVMQDIEELEALVNPEEIGMERVSTGKIIPTNNHNPSRGKQVEVLQSCSESSGGAKTEFFRPGKASIYVKTWGCGHNNSDGEYMAGLLAEHGYEIFVASEDAEKADVWLLNSCTVKGPSEQTFSNDIHKGLKLKKKVIVSGCVPQGEKSGADWAHLSIIGVQQIDQVVYVVEETLKGNIVKLFKEVKAIGGDGRKKKSGGAPLNLPKMRRNPFIEIIPINTGCLNQCTYCKTKHARGDLGSYSPEEIIERAKSVLDEGVLEIWLTSEDLGAYGKDIGTNIVELCWKLLPVLENHPSFPMMRVGMTNPPYILEHLEEMSKILNHPRVYSFLHVPVQAGSNRILDEMRRLYTAQDFELVCDTLLEHVPGITLATDVICGFPTESEIEFDETLFLVQKYRFSVLHISQFYPRPGTPAALKKRVPTVIVKNRSRRLTSLFESYTSYDKLLDTVQAVLITESSNDGKHFVGHNKYFHQILIEKNPTLMGKWVKVKIYYTSKWYMLGKVLPESIDANNGSQINQARIPKLVKVAKKMVALKNVGGENSGHGAFLSARMSKSETTKEPMKAEWNPVLVLSAAAAVSLLLISFRHVFQKNLN